MTLKVTVYVRHTTSGKLAYVCVLRGSCGRAEAWAEGCGGSAALALRLDPARDLQRLHAQLVHHAHRLDDRLLHPAGTRHIYYLLTYHKAYE
jgi:hypothetical protein